MSIIMTILLVLVFVFLWLANAYFRLSDSRQEAIRTYRNYLIADDNETNYKKVAEARQRYNQAASYFNTSLDSFPCNIIGFISSDRFPRLGLEEQQSNANLITHQSESSSANDDQNKAA